MVFLGSFTLHGVLFPGMSRDALRPELLGLVAATSLAFLMGLADDAYDTRPLLKLLVQIACGAVLVLTGSFIDVFPWHWANVLLTMVWTVGLMNAINLLDNMDGITSVVSIGILAAAIAVLLLMGPASSVHIVLMVGVMAALAGFLFFNWHPSRMYMGDTGSQFLGVFLAFVGIRFLWNMPSAAGVWEPERQFLAAITVFLLPIVDTTVVSINRISRGRSPFVGGRDHTTHHLSYAGLSDGQVAMAFLGLSLVNGFLTFVMFRFIIVWQTKHTLIFGAYVLAVWAVLLAVTRIVRRPAQP
ncbi:MAG: MraY family glycosyltransferase [Flavobacteriales bacterium]|jgi:UDP-GlcNAc:undecaprenyl-phosphate GlcNAc-1-phosphate transferase|nr:MraY family glycosyltransferase [Flavobacteriales bacterium]